MAEIERTGIHAELDKKSNKTSGGYFGLVTFIFDQYQPVGIEINVSSRNGKKIIGEIDIVSSDFVPSYTFAHLSQKEIVAEKIFGALLERKKPRDFYDLYFILRKGMLAIEQKSKLALVSKKIISDSKKINFRTELGVFLPKDQQMIIKDFPGMLDRELKRQLSSVRV